MAAIAGIGLDIGGNAMLAGAADEKRDIYKDYMSQWMPDIPGYQESFFKDLAKYQGQASDVAGELGKREWDTALARREEAIPGITKGVKGAADALFPLLRGELPKSVMDAFSMAGGASSVGSGFGGSGFGFTNQGLFGSRGSLAGMQLGYGLLPALLSTMPNVQLPTGMDLLRAGVMNPAQRTQAQLQLRQQQIGMATHLVGMDTADEVWGRGMKAAGGMLMGGGMSGMFSGGMGGGMAPTYTPPQGGAGTSGAWSW
jgi:hypothetical protein